MQKVQINNLKVRFKNHKWQVLSPDNRILEEFNSESEAKLFAGHTFDFLSSLSRKRLKNKRYKDLKYAMFSGDHLLYVNSMLDYVELDYIGLTNMVKE